MGTARRPHRVNLITGLLSKDTELLSKTGDSLARMFGPVDFQSQILDFTHTDYYSREMGQDLKRQFFGFKKLFSLEGLYNVKLKTNRLEKRLSKNGDRAVNIDPGYLDLSKLILFSTKDYSHRIYQGNGILAEATLVYKGKSFTPWPWTYPDYGTEAYIGIFNKIRDMYKAKLACS